MKVPTFQALYLARQRCRRASWRLTSFCQARIDSAHWRGFKSRHPRSRKKRPERGYTLRALDPEHYAALFAEAKPKYDAMQSHLQARLTRIERALSRVSNQPIPEMNYWTKVDERLGGSYHTQGFGANKYARASLESAADSLRHAGIPVHIRSLPDGRTHDMAYSKYELWAPVDAAGYAQAKLRPPVSLVEQVRLCWKRGVNPRVYNPFLPCGFEEENGLDFFGNHKSA